MSRILITMLLSLLIAGTAPAVAETSAAAPPQLGPAWNRLAGEWVGEGSGEPGKGEGGSTFRFELQDRVLVRRSWAKYPTPGGTTSSHEDLLVIYPGTSANDAKAMYWDNEGHVIAYTATWAPDGGTVTFLSELLPGAPRFRLVYSGLLTHTPVVTFEMAPPGQPEAFKPYVSGGLRRVPSKK